MLAVKCRQHAVNDVILGGKVLTESLILLRYSATTCPYALLYHSGFRPFVSTRHMCVTMHLFGTSVGSIRYRDVSMTPRTSPNNGCWPVETSTIAEAPRELTSFLHDLKKYLTQVQQKLKQISFFHQISLDIFAAVVNICIYNCWNVY